MCPHPHVQGGCSQTRGAARDPDVVCTMGCVCKPVIQRHTREWAAMTGDTHQSPGVCVPVRLLFRRPLLLPPGPLREPAWHVPAQLTWPPWQKPL